MFRKLIIPNGYTYEREELVEIISEKKIKERLGVIANEISNRYNGSVPIFIGVLNGAYIYMADLTRMLSINFEVDFIKVKSYNDNLKSSGRVKILKDISTKIENRDIIIVEDIIDTGLTIDFLVKHFKNYNPLSISVTSLINKPDVSKNTTLINWIGFDIPDDFVVGYGLDFCQIFRGLSSIYKLNNQGGK